MKLRKEISINIKNNKEKAKRKFRRGKKTKIKRFSKSLRLLGVNAAGLKSKIFTFKKVLDSLNPSVVFIEETKYKEEGKLKLDNYIIFELVRESGDGGGGLAIACTEDLKPVMTRKGNDEAEALTVEISVEKMKIKCVAGYGPQENCLKEYKLKFWNYIEEEASNAWNNGLGFIFHCDGNLWAGSDLIPGDPRSQNKNGKIFEEFLERNPNLIVVNSLPLCKGVITRHRIKDGKEEKSILDFFIVCRRILPFVTKMVIDEEKKFILTNYKPARKGEKAIDSDHFTEYLDINLKVNPAKPVRKEIYNFKCKQSQETFKEITSDTEEFSNCFEDNNSFLDQIDNWRKVLQAKCQKSFKKIRITNKKKPQKMNPRKSALINIRNKMLKCAERKAKNCQDGEKLFSTKCNFKTPQVNHTNEVKFVCGKCGKRFERKKTLNVHMKTHTKLLDNKWNECDQSFMKKEQFEKHMILTNCGKCGKKSKLLGDNRSHASLHERLSEIQCGFCDRIFPQTSSIKDHKNNHTEQFNDLDEVEKEIAEIEAEENRNFVIKHFKKFSENPENVNLKEVWNTLKKICPKFKTPVPIAKKNFKGKLITNSDEIKALLIQEYTHRLRTRPIRPDLGDIRNRKNEIFKLHLKLTVDISTNPWTLKDLERALASLKNNKARDPAGYVNEIFKEEIIGTDLKNSILIMMDKIKTKKNIPDFMRITNLTTVPKKGSLLDSLEALSFQ